MFGFEVCRVVGCAELGVPRVLVCADGVQQAGWRTVGGRENQKVRDGRRASSRSIVGNGEPAELFAVTKSRVAALMGSNALK